MKHSSSSYAVVRRHFALTQLFVFVTGMLHATLPTQAGTFTVTNTADSGAGSLRQAIVNANASVGTDTILFNIPGAGPHTITVASELPFMDGTVIIDGGNDGVATNRVQLSGGGAFATGLDFRGAHSNEVRNLVINGFTSRQILFLSSSHNRVTGAYLGLNVAGTEAVPGSYAGIESYGDGQIFGGTNAAARNVISPTDGYGIVVASGSSLIQGNFIGLNAAGTARTGSLITGILISNASATIGGTNSGAGNVIAGMTGIEIGGNPAQSRSSAVVQGNRIGTDATGMIALNNSGNFGVLCSHSVNCLVGGDVPAAANVISGNGAGVQSYAGGGPSSNNRILGNLIGVAADGVSALGNRVEGIVISTATDNLVTNNIIAHNGGTGIMIGLPQTGNRVLGNSIYDNGALGIDLYPSGITSNDLCDADSGLTEAQNFPVITAATSTVNSVTIDGFLDSVPSQTYQLEFFANSACDPSGFGEGEFFIGTTNVTTGTNCTNNFTVTFPVAVANAMLITATATGPDGNTSEFSPCRTNVSTVVTPACSLFPSQATNTVGQAHNVTLTVVTNSLPVAGHAVSFSVSGSHAIAPTNVVTDVNGQATFGYTGTTTGTDTIFGYGSLGLVEFGCTATKVWISDTIPPQITCPGNIVTNTAAGQCSRPVSFNATATGVPAPTVTCTPTSGSVFLSGSTLVSCVASNTAGMAACDFTVTVNDLQSPTVNCPANITTNVPAGVTSANVTFLTPTGSDNCAIAQVVCNPSSGSSFSVGTTPVTCTATDTSSNTGQCGFNVTVTQSAASANLGIAKTVNAPTIALGSNVVYSVTVTNAGPDTAESVVVGDALPGLLDFVSASATQGNCTHDDGLVACQLGALAAGAVAGIQIEAETRGIGTNCNYAVVSSATTDPVSSNNRAGACTAVYRPVTGADLSLTKASIPDSMIVSNTALFEVRVQNLGPEPAEGVQIQDVLPAGLEFVGVTTTRGSCAENLGTIACDLGTLGVQSNVTVQVTVRGVELGEACNEAEVTSTTEDPLLSNNADDACVEVREDREKDHDLAVTKIVAPHTVTFTGTKTRIREQVAVTIQNRGPRTETIKNATVLGGLVRLTADSLGSCAAPEIKLTVGGPQVALPLKLEPKQKATVWFDVKFVRECVNDPEQSSAADPGHEDYRWIAVLDHEVIDGKEDTNPEDDVCPRYGRPPFERTPNAPTTIREKGCGDNAPDGSARGGDVLTDVVVP